MSKQLHRLLIPAVASLFCLTLAAIVGLRISYLAATQQIVFGNLAIPPEALDLHDQKTIQQTIAGVDARLTHLGFFIGNNHDAPSSAVSAVTLKDNSGKVLAKNEVAIRDIVPDAPTILPLSAHLNSQELYTLEFGTTGVHPNQKLSLGYEPEAASPYQKVTITLANPSAKPGGKAGHIAATGLWQPTPRAVSLLLINSPLFLTILALTIAFIVITWRYREFFSRWLAPKIPQPQFPKITWQEMIFVIATATLLSLTVTIPYYQSLNNIPPTLNDAHRAFLYRAVARDAAVKDHEIGLWDPYSCGGIPLLANAESAHLDPLFLLTLIFGEQLGIRLSITIAVILAFCGTYIFARQFLNAHKWGALIAATLFAFASFQMVGFAQAFYAWIPFWLIPWSAWLAWRSVYSPRLIPVAALTLAIMLLGGSVHILLYSLFVISLILLGHTLAFRSYQPLVVLVLIAMFTTPLMAIKFLPSTELESITHLERKKEPTTPITSLPITLWGRKNLSEIIPEQASTSLPISHMSYIGIIPTLICAFSLPLLWRSSQRKLYIIIFVSLLLSLLWMLGLPPWTLTQYTPVLSEIFRDAHRASIIFTSFFGLLAAGAITEIIRKIQPSHYLIKVSMGCTVAFILIDLPLAYIPIHTRVFTSPLPAITPSSQFTRFTHAYSTPDNAYYTAGYVNYANNQGMTDMCPVYLADSDRAAHGIDSSNPQKPYLGEAFLLQDGTVSAIDIHTNKVTTALAATAPGYLILNQNFFPGWHTTPSRPVWNYNGLLATSATPDDNQITFYYRPASFIIGSAISLLGILLGVFWIQKTCCYSASCNCQSN